MVIVTASFGTNNALVLTRPPLCHKQPC